MIAVKMEGRLGNQLFQYAFAYASAKKLNTSFYLDKRIDNFLPATFFNLQRDFNTFFDDHFFSINGFKNLFSYHARNTYYELLVRLLMLKQVTFSNEEPVIKHLQNIKNKRIYSGYFQSELYFENVKDEIREQFSIKEKFQASFRAIFTALPKASKYIAVHVRRGDYVNLKIDMRLSYYHNAIKSIHGDDNFYVFVSDDPAFVEQEFEYVHRKYVSRNDEITDLQFLMAADICILSPSSFSWWGGWLNTRNAQIIAPKYWLGSDKSQEFPVGISDNMNFTWMC